MALSWLQVTNSPAFQQLDQAEGMVKLMEFVQQLDEVRSSCSWLC